MRESPMAVADPQQRPAGAVISGGSARISVSSIGFYCDLGNPGGLVISLGVMAEIVVPSIRGLGLSARTELLPEEIRAAGELGAKLVCRPFEFLSREFEDAWENAAPGEALQYLSQRHKYSLHFSVPSPLQVPLRLEAAERGPNARNAVRTYLGEILEEQMLRLLGQEDSSRRPKPQRELLTFKSAA